jgi:aspartate kinase
VVVVVSAMSGETNRLVALGRSVSARPDAREMDVLQAAGEQVTIALLAMALCDRGHPGKSYLADQVAIRTDSSFGKARISAIDTDRLQADLASGIVPVVAGFQGVDDDGNLTTLGRGGSDTTAWPSPRPCSADECEICTDVDGVYTADPRIVDNARRMDQVTFEEMLELASLGSKVLHPRSVEFAGKYQVPLRVLSSFEDGPGTLITMESKRDGTAHRFRHRLFPGRGQDHHGRRAGRARRGVAHPRPGRPAPIEVDMIVQNTGADGPPTSRSRSSATTTNAPWSCWCRSSRNSAPGRCPATTASSRSPWWGWACAPTPASPPACSTPWRRRTSTSR